MTGAWAVVPSLLTAVVGGLVVHFATRARELRSERRRRRLEHLVSAYQRLEGASNRPGRLTEERASALESALADVMLLGSVEEINAARQFMLAMKEGNGASLNPALRSLRKSLRQELNLEEVDPPNPYSLRLDRPEHGEG